MLRGANAPLNKLGSYNFPLTCKASLLTCKAYYCYAVRKVDVNDYLIDSIHPKILKIQKLPKQKTINK